MTPKLDNKLAEISEYQKKTNDYPDQTNKGRGTFRRDILGLLAQYKNLIFYYKKKYGNSNKFSNEIDRTTFLNNDIYNIFIQLCYEFVPYKGIDFKGYIKKMMRYRVVNSYIYKVQKEYNREHPLGYGTEINNYIDFLLEEQGSINVRSIRQNNKNAQIIDTGEITEINEPNQDNSEFNLMANDIVKRLKFNTLQKEIFCAFQLGSSDYAFVKKYLKKTFNRDISFDVIKENVDFVKKQLKSYLLN